MSAPVRLALVGGGARGAGVYGAWLLGHPERARLVALVDPDAGVRARVGDAHGLDTSRRFPDLDALLEADLALDGAIVATPDRHHTEPAARCVEAGLEVLLEKPVATSAEELDRFRARIAGAEDRVTVCHVLRYTPFFQTLHAFLAAGLLGRLVALWHSEHIGWWHYAHSYVRGNWRRRDTSAPLVLTKTCHDLDLLRWMAGAPCTWLASTGGLTWFRGENAPEGATERCTDPCPVEPECVYSAPRFYERRLADTTGWPVSVLGPDTSPEGRRRALEEGPYGRCVYHSDNDVADHQSVVLRFANGVTATLLISAFTEENTRGLRVMGSAGEIRGHMGRGSLEVHDFATGAVQEIPVAPEGRGHAGGDAALMDDWVGRLEARRRGEPTDAAATSLLESLESHALAFAADRARTTGEAVAL